MEYTGIYRKFKVNRPISSQEWHDQLKQKTRVGVDPVDSLSVIEFNSTYIEMVDKFFQWKGLVSSIAFIGFFMFGVFLISITCLSLFTPGRLAQDWPVLMVMWLMMSPVFFLCYWILRKEAFSYTHYPVRFNRKTRMVYVFRTNGTVLSARWDDLFFCIRYATQNFWHIEAHVLAVDKVTVLETFPLHHVSSGGNKESLHHCWEFIRRYMEEGPASVAGLVKCVIPISNRRETAGFAFYRMRYVLGGDYFLLNAIVMLIYAVIYPCRWFAMRTSKIPAWPKEIEDACLVEANDPYSRDERHNPPGLQ